MAWVLFGGERAHKRTEELAQHGGEAGKWGGASSGRRISSPRESDSHVPPPQRTAAAGSAASAQMQPRRYFTNGWASYVVPPRLAHSSAKRGATTHTWVSAREGVHCYRSRFASRVARLSAARGVG